MNHRYLCSVCEDEMGVLLVRSIGISWLSMLAANWMAGTLQHYLMPRFYFSRVSLAERSLEKEKKKKKKITAQLIDSSMVLISSSCAS